MHTYSKENLDQLRNDYDRIYERYIDLSLAYLKKDFKAPKAREFAEHGFCRRVNLMAHCIRVVFEKIPPDTTHPLNLEEVLDATVYFQVFRFNVFGCLDNLAHIWVEEMNIKQDNEKKIPDPSVSFFARHKHNQNINKRLSEEFCLYLNSLNPWFQNLKNFRDAIAHRIPVYIPPYCTSDEETEEYLDIGLSANKEDFHKHGEPKSNLESASYFLPIATHSFMENSEQILFHPQMLSDYNIIDKIGRKLLRELDDTAD